MKRPTKPKYGFCLLPKNNGGGGVARTHLNGVKARGTNPLCYPSLFWRLPFSQRSERSAIKIGISATFSKVAPPKGVKNK